MRKVIAFHEYVLEVIDLTIFLIDRSDVRWASYSEGTPKVTIGGLVEALGGNLELHRKNKVIRTSEGILRIQASNSATLAAFLNLLEVELANWRKANDPQDSEDDIKYEAIRRKLIDTLVNEFKAKLSPEMPLIHYKPRVSPGCWVQKAPSVKGFYYSVDVANETLRLLWHLPPQETAGIAYRPCPNIVIEVTKASVKSLGLSAFIYDGLRNVCNAVTCLYPSWADDLKVIIQEDFPDLSDELISMVFQDVTIPTLLEDKLLQCFDSFKNLNTRNEFALGCGIQFYDSQTPSETQVYQEFYDLFDKHPIPFAKELTKELLSRIVVNRELYLAKLYSGLKVHTGSEYKTSIYVAGPGNSFKTYFIETLAAALSLTWYADGTFSYDASINPMSHTFLKQDSTKGDGRFDDPRGLRRAAFIHWTEEGADWSPTSTMLKARTGTSTLTVEEKGKTTENIPINAVNIFDSNHAIGTWWFGPEGYARCIPVGFFNPSLVTKQPNEYYYSIKADSFEELPKELQEFLSHRCRSNYLNIPFRKLKDLLVGISLLHVIMTEGRRYWMLYKNQSSYEITENAPKSTLEFYRFFFLLSGGYSGLVIGKGDGKKFNFVPLFLSLLAAVVEPGNEEDSVNVLEILETCSKLIANSYNSSRVKQEVLDDLTVALRKIDQSFRNENECQRFFGCSVKSSDGVLYGLKLKQEFREWFSVDVDTLGSLFKDCPKNRIFSNIYDTLRRYYLNHFYGVYEDYKEEW